MRQLSFIALHTVSYQIESYDKADGLRIAVVYLMIFFTTFPTAMPVTGIEWKILSESPHTVA